MMKMTYRNATLTAVALLLAADAGARLGEVLSPAAALAGPPSRSGSPTQLANDDRNRTPFNGAEQRKEANEALDRIERRLASIEARLEGGISVKVTEMPAVKVQDDRPAPARKDAGPRADATPMSTPASTPASTPPGRVSRPPRPGAARVQPAHPVF